MRTPGRIGRTHFSLIEFGGRVREVSLWRVKVDEDGGRVDGGERRRDP